MAPSMDQGCLSIQADSGLADRDWAGSKGLCQKSQPPTTSCWPRGFGQAMLPFPSLELLHMSAGAGQDSPHRAVTQCHEHQCGRQGEHSMSALLPWVTALRTGGKNPVELQPFLTRGLQTHAFCLLPPHTTATALQRGSPLHNSLHGS